MSGEGYVRVRELWLRDTVCTVFSSTKGATAICAHLLKDRNLLDFEAPVKKYWPEFAKKGKETALVKMALDHSIECYTIENPFLRVDSTIMNIWCVARRMRMPFGNPAQGMGIMQ